MRLPAGRRARRQVLVAVAVLTLATPAPAGGAPSLSASGCPLFPADVVADNGSSGFIGGVPDQRWDNDALHQLRRVTLADFEAVDTAPLRVSPASAAFRAGIAATPTRPTPPAATSSGDGSGGPSVPAVLGLALATLALAGVAGRSRSRRHRSCGRHARPTLRGR